MTKPKNGATTAAQFFVISALSFLRPSSFVLRHFFPVHSSSVRRIASFSAAIFFPIKTSSVLFVSKGSNSQRPATKLKRYAPSAKRTKPFARITVGGRLSANRSKQSREKVLSDLNVNESNSS